MKRLPKLRRLQRGMFALPAGLGAVAVPGGGGGGTGIVGVSTYQRGGNSTTHNITLPSGIVAGELLIVLYCVDGIPNVSSITSGWTASSRVSDGNNGCSFYTFTRIAAGGDTLSVMFSASENGCGVCLRVAGKSNFVASCINQASTASPNPPNLTPAGGLQSYIWLAGVAIGSDATTVTAEPASYDFLASEVSLGSTSANNTRIHVVERETTATSEDPGAFTVNPSGTNLAFTAAIW